MLKGFEDAFVDAQASVISLGLELLSNSGKANCIQEMIGFHQEK